MGIHPYPRHHTVDPGAEVGKAGGGERKLYIHVLSRPCPILPPSASAASKGIWGDKSATRWR